MPVASRPSPPMLRILPALVAALLLFPTASAQGSGAARWHASIIVSATGGGALGQRHARAAERGAAALRSSGIYGADVRIDVHDDGGDPRRAESLALAALEGGALAVICCTSIAATDRVAALAEEHGGLLLALDAGRSAEGHWVLQLAPTARAQMTAIAVHAAEEGKAALGLMTLDTGFGDDAERAFERALADTGRTGVGVARYAPTASVLTPEALWMATREPGSVIVWGLEGDTAVALEALRRRGYLGPVYVRPSSLPPAAWRRSVRHELGGDTVVPSRTDAWLGARLAVPPVMLGNALPAEHPNAPAVQAFAARILGDGDALGGTTSPLELVDLATVDDALQLLRSGFEAVAELGIPESSPLVTTRLALRDVFLSAPPRRLAAGTYAALAGDSRAARWEGLVVVSVGAIDVR